LSSTRSDARTRIEEATLETVAETLTRGPPTPAFCQDPDAVAVCVAGGAVTRRGNVHCVSALANGPGDDVAQPATAASAPHTIDPRPRLPFMESPA